MFGDWMSEETKIKIFVHEEDDEYTMVEKILNYCPICGNKIEINQ